MKKNETGAWIIHHGRKISSVTGGSAHYSAIDVSSKCASLLARMSGSEQTVLAAKTVEGMAKAGGLNPKTELPFVLNALSDQAVIKVGASGGIEVLGVTTHTALGHATDLFEQNDPTSYERASIELSEIASLKPVRESDVTELIGDKCKLASAELADFFEQARGIGFVDHEGDGTDRVLFNGNLFRRESAQKTMKVLNSLKSNEATLLVELLDRLNKIGALPSNDVQSMLGDQLMSKLRAAAVFDESVVANSTGEFAFVTSPGSFHKYASPMEDDAFDQAKALVAALKYGMSMSPSERGRIWGVSLLLKKLLRGGEVGPAPAIGQDYRALERVDPKRSRSVFR